MSVSRLHEAAATLLAILALAASANADPSVSLEWTHLNGTPTGPGVTSIEAMPGDVLRLLVTVVDDGSGINVASLSLAWDGADLLAFAPEECPAPENQLGSGLCSAFGGLTPPAVMPFAPGVTIDDVLGHASSFDAGGQTLQGDMLIGALEFEVVPGAGLETVAADYVPGTDAIHMATHQLFFPPASATVDVPEPAGPLMLGAGIVSLAALRRRRGRASRRHLRLRDRR